MNFRSALVSGLTALCLVQNAAAAPLDALTKNLSKGAASLKNKKIAVLAFPYHDGRVSSGSSVISERLTTELVGKKGIRVVERRLVEQLLAEKKLSETGVITQENLKDIGTILEADAIVTGTLIDLTNGKTEINARMIRADSGEVLSAAQESIERTWKDSPKMPRKPGTEKKVERKPAIEPEMLPDERHIVRPSSTGRKSGKTPMRLSNESFPPSRRIYHGNNPAPKKKSPYQYYEKREEDEDEGSYEDGYADAYRDAQKSKTTSNKSSSKNTKYTPPPPPERGLQHPTAIGVIRSEGSYPYYPPSSYRKE